MFVNVFCVDPTTIPTSCIHAFLSFFAHIFFFALAYRPHPIRAYLQTQRARIRLKEAGAEGCQEDRAFHLRRLRHRRRYRGIVGLVLTYCASITQACHISAPASWQWVPTRVVGQEEFDLDAASQV